MVPIEELLGIEVHKMIDAFVGLDDLARVRNWKNGMCSDEILQEKEIQWIGYKSNLSNVLIFTIMTYEMKNSNLMAGLRYKTP